VTKNKVTDMSLYNINVAKIFKHKPTNGRSIGTVLRLSSVVVCL